MILDQMGLESSQKEEIESKLQNIDNKYQIELVKLNGERQKARDDFQQALVQNASDKALKVKHDLVQDWGKKISDERFKQILEIRSLFTEEQRKVFYDLMHSQRGFRQGKGLRGDRNGRGEQFGRNRGNRSWTDGE